MNRFLVLQQVIEGGAVELGRLEGGQTVLGREPDAPGGIAVPAKAVSRNHGVVARYRNHWFYKDLGSTNGSWYNGNQVKADQLCLIRAGGVLQLADVAIKLVQPEADRGRSNQNVSVPGNQGRSLIVFSDGELVDEYPIPEYGRALMVGGSQGDLTLEGDVFELPSVVVERKGDRICAYRMVKEVQASHNDNPLTDVVNLCDGDQVKIGQYIIFFNDPTESQTISGDRSGEERGWGVGQPSPMGDPVSQPPQRFGAKTPLGRGFGSGVQPATDETMSMDLDELESRLGQDVHPSMRYIMKEEWRSPFSGLEDRIVIFIGIILFVILAVLVVFWVWG